MSYCFKIIILAEILYEYKCIIFNEKLQKSPSVFNASNPSPLRIPGYVAAVMFCEHQNFWFVYCFFAEGWKVGILLTAPKDASIAFHKSAT